MMLLVAMSVEGCRSPVAAALAVTAVVRGQAVPSQRGVPCTAAWLVLYLPVSWLL